MTRRKLKVRVSATITVEVPDDANEADVGAHIRSQAENRLYELESEPEDWEILADIPVSLAPDPLSQIYPTTVQQHHRTDDDAIHAAMTEALIVLQDHVGQTDGGMASMYWDEDWNGIGHQFRAYLQAERDWLDPDPRQQSLPLAAIVEARDHCAAHGSYPAPPYGPREDQSFDDWSADIVEAHLGRRGSGQNFMTREEAP